MAEGDGREPRREDGGQESRFGVWGDEERNAETRRRKRAGGQTDADGPGDGRGERTKRVAWDEEFGGPWRGGGGRPSEGERERDKSEGWGTTSEEVVGPKNWRGPGCSEQQQQEKEVAEEEEAEEEGSRAYGGVARGRGARTGWGLPPLSRVNPASVARSVGQREEERGRERERNGGTESERERTSGGRCPSPPSARFL